MSNEENIKLVEFEKWCSKCEHFEVDEGEDPCNECLSVGGRYASHKPERFVECSKEKIRGKRAELGVIDDVYVISGE